MPGPPTSVALRVTVTSLLCQASSAPLTDVVGEVLTVDDELREMIAATTVTDAVFRSNHASNYLPVGGRLPHDKEAMLAALDGVLAAPQRARLKPEEWRLL